MKETAERAGTADRTGRPCHFGERSAAAAGLPAASFARRRPSRGGLARSGRRATTGFLLLLAALLALPLQAQAQAPIEVWAGTLTVRDSVGVLGCSNGYEGSHCSDYLSDDDFTHDGTDYVIKVVWLRPNGALEFEVDTVLTTALEALTLTVDGTAFAFADADLMDAQWRRWSNSGLNWSVGDHVSLRLKLPFVNTAPTASNNTVTASYNMPYVFAAADFNFADADSDSLASVKIVHAAADGQADARRHRGHGEPDHQKGRHRRGQARLPLVGGLGRQSLYAFHLQGGRRRRRERARLHDVHQCASDAPYGARRAAEPELVAGGPAGDADVGRPVERRRFPRSPGTSMRSTTAGSGWTRARTGEPWSPVLTNGRRYTFAVRAVNAAGGGEVARVTVTPGTEPGAPRNLSGSPGDKQVTLTWDAPSSDGGSTITRYEYEIDDSGAWMDAGTDRRAVVTGLTNGRRYTFAVRAVNAAGGGEVARVTVTPGTGPGAPRNLSGSPGDKQVTLTWGRAVERRRFHDHPVRV